MLFAEVKRDGDEATIMLQRLIRKLPSKGFFNSYQRLSERK